MNIATMEKKLQTLEANANALQEVKENLEAPFHAKIEKLEKEMEAATEKVSGQIDKANTACNKLEVNIKLTKKQAKEDKWKTKAPQNFEELEAWIDVHNESKKFMLLDGAGYTANMFDFSLKEIRPTKLVNDITVLGAHDGEYKMYIAAKNKKIVGHLITEIPKHPGSWTCAGARINNKKVEFETTGSGNPAKPYRTWLNKLKKLK